MQFRDTFADYWPQSGVRSELGLVAGALSQEVSRSGADLGGQGANGSADQLSGDSAGRGSLDAWRALVGSLDGDALARAVLLDGVELLGGVAGSVVVVVLVVDVVHVVVVDVGPLEGLVALEVALTAPENLLLALGVDSDGLAHA